MSKLLDDFVSDRLRIAVKEAVRLAEAHTSGEIKVLIVERSKPRFSLKSAERAVEERAEKEFLALGIQQTKDRTGVLIMISLKEQRVSIKADKSIDEKVEKGTWDKAVKAILDGIMRDDAPAGIANAIWLVGEHLSLHFPIKKGDTNELSNELDAKE